MAPQFYNTLMEYTCQIILYRDWLSLDSNSDPITLRPIKIVIINPGKKDGGDNRAHFEKAAVSYDANDKRVFVTDVKPTEGPSFDSLIARELLDVPQDLLDIKADLVNFYSIYEDGEIDGTPLDGDAITDSVSRLLYAIEKITSNATCEISQNPSSDLEMMAASCLPELQQLLLPFDLAVQNFYALVHNKPLESVRGMVLCPDLAHSLTPVYNDLVHEDSNIRIRLYFANEKVKADASPSSNKGPDTSHKDYPLFEACWKLSEEMAKIVTVLEKYLPAVLEAVDHLTETISNDEPEANDDVDVDMDYESDFSGSSGHFHNPDLEKINEQFSRLFELGPFAF